MVSNPFDAFGSKATLSCCRRRLVLDQRARGALNYSSRGLVCIL